MSEKDYVEMMNKEIQELADETNWNFDIANDEMRYKTVCSMVDRIKELREENKKYRYMADVLKEVISYILADNDVEDMAHCNKGSYNGYGFDGCCENCTECAIKYYFSEGEWGKIHNIFVEEYFKDVSKGE